ncbi:MAG: Gfo/Idh/MocA family oxidoreductase [Clostridia bacterium]|nr:Gfo/Idh/MocA family oxidoreductase [Clostridia bacterium]MBR3714329.1 Gfo/Idh/MocA family oxidoreductase [Clostridia bacterium]
MKKIKIIQVGIGHDHSIPTYRSMVKQSDVFDVLGLVLCDGEAEKFAKKLKSYGDVKIFTLDEALEIKDLDAVAIECEDCDLTRYSMLFAERGVHIHMDKPGGVSQDEYERMLSVMKKKGLVFQTGYMYRYNPVIAEKLAAARRGDFGEIYSVEAHMDCIHPKEKRAWLGDYPGGMMYYLGCHLIDLIVLFQGLPEEIIPFNMPTGFDGVTASDYGMAVLKYENGISFAKTCAAEPGGFMRRQIVVCGKDATVEMKPTEQYVDGANITTPTVIRKSEGGWQAVYSEERAQPFDRYDTMMRHFAEYIRGERENPYTYEYEAQIHKVVLAACGVSIDYKARIKL